MAKLWPYAADSVGAHRGSLNIGGKIGRLTCFDAIGSAREVFIDTTHDGEPVKGLGGILIDYLENNFIGVHEPDTYIGVSLFMIGKREEHTKPIVMIVSNDNPCAKKLSD